MKTKVILIMMFVAAGFVVPGWADFRTVGIYDPTGAEPGAGPHFNDADLSGVYSSSAGGASAANVIDLATMKAAIIDLFDPNNMGGVIDCYDPDNNDGEPNSSSFVDIGGNRTIRARYGVSQAKTVDMTDPWDNMGTSEGFSGGGEMPISGKYRFVPGTAGGFTLQIGNIDGDPGERVIMMGMTILQETDRGGSTIATAYFSDGSWVRSVGSITGFGEPSAHTSDCFFGFVAPAGEYITQFNMGAGGGVPGWRDADDIGFITSVGPFAPSSNAGPDQLGVQLWDATGLNVSTGVILAGSVALPITETYTYTWTGGFDTITDNASETATDPIVTFTAAGTYVLTLNINGSVSGPLYSDTVTIEVIESDSNAGSNQTVQLHIANSTGVILDGSVDDPYDASDVEGVENYTYAWSGGFVGSTTTGATPTVTFTTTGDHIVTLAVTGDIQGTLDPNDTVRIRVVIPVLDAGDDVSVERSIAEYPGVYMDSTLSDPVGGETYTYTWSSVPGWTSISDNGTSTATDPAIAYPSDIEEYALTLDVTNDGVTPALQDTVTVNVTDDHILVSHFAIDPNYQDSSREGGAGDPNTNHVFITDTIGGSTAHDGVVDCEDDHAIENSNNAPLEVHLDHTVKFDDNLPHLDNLSAAITVAFWIKNDYGRKVWAIEKESSFAFGIDDGGDLRTQLWFVTGDPNLIRSKDGNGLGDDLHDDKLKINADRAASGSNDEHVWHHIAFAYDSFTGYVEQFLDGALIYEKYVGSGRLLVTGETSLFIGKNVTDFGQGVEGLRGAMDDIRIYNYPLEYSEIAGLASMGEAATMVYAGADVTVDPNELPYQLQGRFIRLGQGVAEVSPDEVNEYFVMWELAGNEPNVIFSDPGDPESDVTFGSPGTYTLRLVSRERLCDGDNQIRSEMEITVLAATDCAGYIALGGVHLADIADNDCLVSLPDLAALAAKWGADNVPTYSIVTSYGRGADEDVQEHDPNDNDNDTGQNYLSIRSRRDSETDPNLLRHDVAFLRFDISTLTIFPVTSTLSVYVQRTEPNTFDLDIFGLVDYVTDEIDWSPSTLSYINAPGFDPNDFPNIDRDHTPGETTYLGTVSITGGVGGTYSMTNAALTAFINADTNGVVTFILEAQVAASDEDFYIEIGAAENSNYGQRPNLEILD